MSTFSKPVVLYGDFLERPLQGSAFAYCDRQEQLINFVFNHPEYEIRLFYKPERGQELDDIIAERHIYKTFTSANEQDLLFAALCEALQSTHNEVIKHREKENYAVADLLERDIPNLLDQRDRRL